MTILTRDPKFIEGNLYIKDDKIYTKVNTIIEVPKRYLNKELLEIKEYTHVFGVWAMRMGDKYSVGRIPCMFKTLPLNITEYKLNEVEYVQFLYGRDMCIFESNSVVMNNLLTYNIFDEDYMLGKMPWFMEYEDAVKIMDNFLTFANSNVGSNYVANEIITSFITRSKLDRSKFYRTVIANKNELKKKEYAFTGIDDVFYSAPTTLNKLAGNYYNDGVVSAILQPEKTIGGTEKLVRA